MSPARVLPVQRLCGPAAAAAAPQRFSQYWTVGLRGGGGGGGGGVGSPVFEWAAGARDAGTLLPDVASALSVGSGLILQFIKLNPARANPLLGLDAPTADDIVVISSSTHSP